MKSVFITGASSGIGKELSLAYAKLGWCVGISARRLQLLEEVSEQAKDLSGQIFTYQLDVQDAEQCKVIAEKFIEQANGISCAIANASICNCTTNSIGLFYKLFCNYFTLFCILHI